MNKTTHRTIHKGSCLMYIYIYIYSVIYLCAGVLCTYGLVPYHILGSPTSRSLAYCFLASALQRRCGCPPRLPARRKGRRRIQRGGSPQGGSESGGSRAHLPVSTQIYTHVYICGVYLIIFLCSFSTHVYTCICTYVFICLFICLLVQLFINVLT